MGFRKGVKIIAVIKKRFGKKFTFTMCFRNKKCD